MATVAEAKAAGQYQGWPDWQIEADLKARGGNIPNQPQNGGGGSTQLSAPDLGKLSQQAADIIHPYYVELAKQAKGNFDEAIKLMTSDYKSGVKRAKEDFAYEQKYGTANLNSALSTLGLDFTKENESTIGDLNKRGAAVYQNNPDGTPNVVQGATFNPSFDPNTYDFNAGVSGPNANMSNLGRGGYESEQMRKAQSLRAEATMRAGMKPLEAAGINLRQTTNAGSFDPNNPLAAGDYSQYGSLERSLQSGYKTQKNDYLERLLAQRAQERGEISNIAGQYGNTKTGAIDEASKNQMQKQYNTDFVQSGLV